MACKQASVVKAQLMDLIRRGNVVILVQKTKSIRLRFKVKNALLVC